MSLKKRRKRLSRSCGESITRGKVFNNHYNPKEINTFLNREESLEDYVKVVSTATSFLTVWARKNRTYLEIVIQEDNHGRIRI